MKLALLDNCYSFASIGEPRYWGVTAHSVSSQCCEKRRQDLRETVAPILAGSVFGVFICFAHWGESLFSSIIVLQLLDTSSFPSLHKAVDYLSKGQHRCKSNMVNSHIN